MNCPASVRSWKRHTDWPSNWFKWESDPKSSRVNRIDLIYSLREGNGTPLQDSCLENPMDRGAWKCAVHSVTEGRTRLSDFTFTFHFQALEKEMATHSSVLAWRISGMGEPGGLSPMGWHRVGHDWSDLAAAAAIYSLEYLEFGFFHILHQGFFMYLPWNDHSGGNVSACSVGDPGSIPGSGCQENPLENGMATTPVFLPGEFHGQRYSPLGCKD